MVVEDIPTPSKEAFVVEIIVLPWETPVETMEAVSPLEGMIGTTSSLEEIMVKAVDSIHASKASLMDTIFISWMVHSSNNLP